MALKGQVGQSKCIKVYFFVHPNRGIQRSKRVGRRHLINSIVKAYFVGKL